MIKSVLSYVRPRVRRLSESELEFIGHALQPCLALSCGPFLLLVDLPQRLQKHDPLPSVEDLNAAAQRFGEELGRRLAAFQPGGFIIQPPSAE